MTILDVLLVPVLDKPLWMWASFLALIALLLLLDLGVLNRKAHVISIRESLWQSAFYVAFALAYGAAVWWFMGADAGMRYLTAYFAVPREFQHRVLFWGIVGVLVLRGVMIGLGAALVAEFHWILYLFGAFLLFTGVKMLFLHGDQEPNLADNAVIGLLRRKMRVTDSLHGDRFFVRRPAKRAKGGKAVLWATPLFLALVVVELSDVVFAVDSVPAVFAISTDPFIVYTSNIFAILGLRALYFALAAMVHHFVYLKYALALVLVFIGGKIFYVELVGKVPVALSLGVTAGLLAAGVLVSLLRAPPVVELEKEVSTS
ncbi:TerC/Alx family metal homeostasis membrane protein [Rhodospirillum sp. A1_3_36]|uniref:TerC/Alx family metal homeostasis membrane protein n=1 Tax=Rhodospirillum sp. A1_3_36 TaxID=3391666 RepID=UPI0039A5506B